MNDTLAKYEYRPADPKKLTLKAVLHKLRDYRLLFIFSIPVYIMWISFAIATISMSFIYDFKSSKDYADMATTYAALIVSGLVIAGVYMPRKFNINLVVVVVAISILFAIFDICP